MPYKDKEKIKEYYKKYHLENYSKYKDSVFYKEKNKEKCKAYREKNKDKISLYRKVYNQRNKDKLAIWRKTIRSQKNYYQSKRRLIIKTQCPKWADLEKIKQIYIDCPKGYHVDHIVPLNNPVVCGLHVENNLKIVTAEYNLKKGNRFKV